MVMVLRMIARVMITTLAYIKDIGSTEKILLFPNVRRTNPAVCLSVCSSNQILVMMMMMVVMMMIGSLVLPLSVSPLGRGEGSFLAAATRHDWRRLVTL